jgi:hypothetical protein
MSGIGLFLAVVGIGILLLAVSVFHQFRTEKRWHRAMGEHEYVPPMPAESQKPLTQNVFAVSQPELDLSSELEREMTEQVTTSEERKARRRRRRRRESLNPEVRVTPRDPNESELVRMRRLTNVSHAGNLSRLPLPDRPPEMPPMSSSEEQSASEQASDYLIPDSKLEEVKIYEVGEDGAYQHLITVHHYGENLVHFYGADGEELDESLHRTLWMQMARERRVAPSAGRHYLYTLLEFYKDSDEPGAWVAMSNLDERKVGAA